MNRLICFAVLLIAIFLLSTGDVNAQRYDWGEVYKIGDFLIHSKKVMKVDMIRTASGFKNPQNKDPLYSDNKYLLLGNADILLGVYKKYKIPYAFASYKVATYTGKLASPNFKTDTAAYRFRTRIREQCKSKGINFAGHYTVAMWGCGSDCRTYAIVDRITGRIYYSDIYKLGYDFEDLAYKANSKMLIMNNRLLEHFEGYVQCREDSKVKVVKWENARFQPLAMQK